MYSIGDRIVYPMHGAGVIESIEEKEILGELQKYYVMKLPFGDMKVMIPILNVSKIGIRDVIDKSEVEKVYDSFREDVTEPLLSWNKRVRENMEKIKSGNIYEVAKVVKMLMCRDMKKSLSTGEKKMLSNAKQILISELVLANGDSEKDVEARLDEILIEEMG